MQNFKIHIQAHYEPLREINYGDISQILQSQNAKEHRCGTQFEKYFTILEIQVKESVI